MAERSVYDIQIEDDGETEEHKRIGRTDAILLFRSVLQSMDLGESNGVSVNVTKHISF